MSTTKFNSDQHLSNDELIAYQQGNLSNKEMHRLELHLVDCELCSDALEGLSSIDPIVLDKHLSNIRVKTETKTSKQISYKQIMAIAASLILVAVVSVVLVKMPHDEPVIAENMTSPNKESIKNKDLLKSSDRIEKADSTDLPEENVLALSEPPPEQVPPQTKQELAKEDEPVFEEEVEHAIDVAVAKTEINDSSATLLAVDTINKDSLMAEDISIAAINEQDQRGAARSKKMAAPAAAVESQDLGEVQKTDNFQDVSNYEPATPIKGIRSYNRYLKRNLIYPAAAEQNKIEGELVIEVDITEDGLIVGTRVVTSLGFGCDEEALRLVHEGSDWQPSKMDGKAIRDKVNITITFKL